MKTKFQKQILAEMRNNPANWKGFFYFNRQDQRVFVPKYYPILGWTLNFANPYTYYTLIGIIIIYVVSSLIF